MKKLLLPILALLLCVAPALGQHTKVQAIFLFQFARYTSWPKDDVGNSFIISIVGSDEMATELRRMTEGKSIGGRPIDVVTSSSPRNLPKSEIVFLGGKFGSNAKSVINNQYGHPVLIVTQGGGMCVYGAGVTLVPSGDNVTFEASKHNLEKCGIKMSPKVLAMGKEVY